eukprot:TRINITY_DN5803_c3_g1_i3.p1 TRINITY_DN5803_c3_g1~~TRINITY_DN5803_c3_g1_i3.p1  ORF type:complete len:644 (+),score=129.29 TRINITY_DN5803_c3_g1_i3:114-1934(+)
MAGSVDPDSAMDPPTEWLKTLEALPEEEQVSAERAWGFNRKELEACLKVVCMLRHDPEIFLRDPILKSSLLWRWVNRPPHLRGAGKRVHQQLQKELGRQKRKQQREDDQRKIAKTEMRVQRNEALERLLTIDPSKQRALLVEKPDGRGPQLLLSGDADGEGDVAMIEDSAGAAEPAAAAAAPAAEGAADQMEVADGENVLRFARKCHICKMAFKQLHSFYYALCRSCGDFNHQKRLQTRDLKGKHVLLTGSRIKIGFQIALRLLRDGAILWATTRFPKDAVKRFELEADYKDWQDRLHLHQLDLRDLWSVKQFCRYMCAHVPSLFAIVHNAAQTIARPPEYTRDLVQGEMAPGRPAIVAAPWQDFVDRGGSAFIRGQQQQLEHQPGAAPLIAGSAEAALLATAPEGADVRTTTVITDAGAQQMVVSASKAAWYDMYDTMQEATDQRTKNSWTSDLAEVSCEEAAEVHAINALAPFIINARLKVLMEKRGPAEENEKRFIINVSAMEGQFYRFKSTTHPHTNMAKASLNMMTRTSGSDYAKSLIYMNSVDTGWITDESPYEKQRRRAQAGNLCPLDEIDAAARVLDLIYTDSAEHSKFWKDYHQIPW